MRLTAEVWPWAGALSVPTSWDGARPSSGAGDIQLLRLQNVVDWGQ